MVGQGLCSKGQPHARHHLTPWALVAVFSDCNRHVLFSLLTLSYQVGHFQDETSLDLPCCYNAPRERDGLSSKRSISDSALSGLA